jgi:hypothetical protein
MKNIRLSRGDHEDRQSGMCLLEAASYIAGEPHSDHPDCVCPVIAAFGRSINDLAPFNSDAERTEFLLAYAPRMIGTRRDSEKVMHKRFDAARDCVEQGLRAKGRMIARVALDNMATKRGPEKAAEFAALMICTELNSLRELGRTVEYEQRLDDCIHVLDRMIACGKDR